MNTLIEYASSRKLCLYFCQIYQEYFFTLKLENKSHWKLIVNCCTGKQ